MTAEIVIMNRSGVALAADSAVTIGDGSGAKIYNTVNKVFALTKHRPIGLMIHGQADYMSIPWETVVKLYREQLGRRSFPTVKEYAADFLRYVSRECVIDQHDEQTKVAQIWYQYFTALNAKLRRALVRTAAQLSLSESDVVRIFLGAVREEVERLKQRDTLPQYRRANVNLLHRRMKKDFDVVKAAAFQGRPFTPAIDAALREYASLLLVKDEFEYGASGFVIAGFGEDEIFPTMYSQACAGYLLGRMKLSKPAIRSITSRSQDSVVVRPFAQREMVDRFMQGIDPSYSTYIRQGLNQLVKMLAENLVTRYASGSAVAKARKAAAAQRTAVKMVAEFEKKATDFRRRRFVMPTLNVVSVLPKEELAELAGALVNITSLKRKFAMEAETVGGPVDVAVISKGDGFIWIRRKHYFRPELNPAFLQNYMSDGN